ncbi:MAG: HD domain-containing phosphohydrolase [Candidatus Acidiferrales bacterium]|jgi:putative nucleotidyltransferase with HDIG domain|nr:HD domain-containing phosphohydrolase [Candidatus Acidoferrales bacterium]
MPQEPFKATGMRRLRILWIVLGALLFTSTLPLWLYHREVLQLSEEKLQDTERLQQSEVTRSIASEILQFESNLTEQLESQRQLLALTGWIQNVSDPAHAPQLSRMLQNVLQNNRDILYVTTIGTDAKGESAESVKNADRDPFVDAALKRAFTASVQKLPFVSGTFALGQENRPAFVVSIPLMSDGQFTGMLAAVVSLDHVVVRLKDASVRGGTVFIVSVDGRIVVHPDTVNMVPGRDLSSNPVVVQFKKVPEEIRTTETTQFTLDENDKPVEMIGTYSTVPELRWAVIAQRSLAKARVDAGVQELTTQAMRFVIAVTLIALLVGYLSALGITRPIQGLVRSTRAISRAEFHERAPVEGAAEISELAETFNGMADDIEKYVDRLQMAATENRELFMGSIRMLAAAIDEKDPYTRGHSGRVAKYSLTIAQEMGLDSVAMDKLRISALLHDVGKIGVDDSVLKKPGKLTEDEFALMKQHPAKGANIMRPVAQLKEMLPGIELHHERMDGGGYPYGLKGDEIPMMARIIAVADTFDAITTNRPYQSAMDLEYAMDRISQLAGAKFDVDVVHAIQRAVAAGKLKLSPSVVEVEVAV